ncbi:citrate synthase [Bacteroidetes bacterium endosymbiont of Geopemphigus sp.]|uniref:citrate synthase n=1 Tax=Bacteroidetes bacterium endosymbiont of Geopemphigus sp. TaxID=2047937 RepID=UPI000CD24EB4|nr:citrate synthase [Bacteroidetes bacterium endosymbiont of Geopemphigus sp.]
MDQIATISIEGKTYSLPIIKGSLGDKALDITHLRTDTGYITLDSGFKNTGAIRSTITFLDGEKGELLYRGYPIEQLAEKSTFLDVSYLLINGELPTVEQSKKFQTDIKKFQLVNEELFKILDGFPRSAHPMGILCSLTCALTAFNPDAIGVHSGEELQESLLKLLAKFPVLAAWTHRKRQGLIHTYPDNQLDYPSNILKMLFSLPTESYEINPVISRALDKLLILHADHEQNCSTSTVHLVGSAHAGLFASVSSGVSALWGRLHGGANEAVIEMLENILKDGGNLKKWIEKAKDKNDPFRMMGFGHRIYRNFDPRARIIKKTTEEVLNQLGIHDPLLDLAMKLEDTALKDSYFIERRLYPNVDFYSGIIYRAIGIPNEMFTVMFAIGRLPGWMAHWKEMRIDGEPIGRPRQVYTGHTKRDVKDYV